MTTILIIALTLIDCFLLAMLMRTSEFKDNIIADLKRQHRETLDGIYIRVKRTEAVNKKLREKNYHTDWANLLLKFRQQQHMIAFMYDYCRRLEQRLRIKPTQSELLTQKQRDIMHRCGETALEYKERVAKEKEIRKQNVSKICNEKQTLQ